MSEKTATSPEQMLREFHATLNVHGGLAPEAPTADVPDWVRDLRLTLLDEEVGELREAMLRGDIEKIADGIADIVYVAVGTAVPYGVPFDAVFREVHRSNMTKTNDPSLGKLVKGPGYEAPRIAEIVKAGAQPVPEIAEEPGLHAGRADRLEIRLIDAEYQSARWVADAASWHARTDALRNALESAAAVLDDIAAEDRNGYCGQRARGALNDARKALEA
jgi:predicted HAD superfamily Cof-like phosphohydrolase